MQWQEVRSCFTPPWVVFIVCGGEGMEAVKYLLQCQQIHYWDESILTFVHIPSALVTRVSSQVHDESGFIYILRNTCCLEYLTVTHPDVETQSKWRICCRRCHDLGNVTEVIHGAPALKRPLCPEVAPEPPCHHRIDPSQIMTQSQKRWNQLK